MAHSAWDAPPPGMSQEVISLWAMVAARFRAQDVLLEDALRRIATLEAANCTSLQEQTTRPSLSISVATLAGREVVSLDADVSWTRQDVCSRIPGLAEPALRAARVLYAGKEISDNTALGALGVVSGTCLQLVLDQRKGLRVLSCGEDVAKLWNPESGECLLTLPEGHAVMHQADFSSDGSSVLTLFDEGVKLWSLESGGCLQTFLAGRDDHIDFVAFSPVSSLIAAIMGTGTAKVLSAKSGECLRILEGHADGANMVGFSPDGALIVAACDDGMAKLWSTESGRCLHTLDGGDSAAVWAKFSPDGALVVTGYDDGTAKLWGTEPCECHRTLWGHDVAVYYAEISPGSKFVLTTCVQGIAHVWHAESGKCLQTFGVVARRAATFSIDGALAVIAPGNTPHLWDAESGECVRTFEGHEDQVNAVTLSPDGSLLATASVDTTVRLWSVESGECIRMFEGHDAPVYSLSFSPPVSQVGLPL